MKRSIFLGSILALCLLILFSGIAIAESGNENGWIKQADHLLYYKNGTTLTGTQTINGSIFIFTSEGWLKGDGKVQIVEENFYYPDSSGTLLYGWQTISEHKYYFNTETGRAYKASWDWYTGDATYVINGIRYAFNHEAHLVISSWFCNVYGDSNGQTLTGYKKVDGQYYFFNEYGATLSGFQSVNGQIHYFWERYNQPNPEIRNWVKVGNKWYYLDPSTGIITTGQVTINNHSYKFNADGTLVINSDMLIYDNDYVYGCDKSGEFIQRWRTIEGKTYYFESIYTVEHNSGYYSILIGDYYLESNDGSGYGYYYFGTNGQMQTNCFITIQNNIYYYGPDGKMLTGFQTIEGYTYYFNPAMVLGAQELYLNNQWVYYYFNDEGQMQTGFITIENETYYYGSDGKRIVGWQKIDGYTYFFNPGMFIGEHDIYWENDSGSYYFDDEGRMQTGFITIEGQKYYYGTDGKRLDGWQTIEGYTYYFSPAMLIGSQTMGYDANWNPIYYFFDDNGRMQTNYFATIDGKKYYYGEDGKRITGWLVLENNTYFFNPEMFTGEHDIYWEDNSGSYYFDEEGRMQTGFITIGGKKYYYGTDGKRLDGWQTIEGYTYYFNPEMLIGSQGIGYDENWNTNYYYFDDSGHMMTNYLATVDGKKYYYGQDGIRVSGWLNLEEFTYYFGPEMLTGIHDISWYIEEEEYYDSGCFFFDENGHMMANYLATVNGNRYYFGEDGRRMQGWQTIEGVSYYFEPYALTGLQQIGYDEYYNEIYYYFDNEGRMQTNSWYEENGKKFYFGANGQRLTGWLILEGYTYYLNPEMLTDGDFELPPPTSDTGLMTDTGIRHHYFFDVAGHRQTNYLAKIDGKKYYYDEYGIRITGWRYIGSDTYYFDPAALTGGPHYLERDGVWDNFTFDSEGRLILQGDDSPIPVLISDAYYGLLLNGTAIYEKPQNKQVTSVFIPDKISYDGKNYKVTYIQDEACKGMKSLKTVTIGKYVNTIGMNAFTSCIALTSVNGGIAVVTIDDSAFSGCKLLKSFAKMNKVQTIGSYAFKGCAQLGKFTLGSKVKYIGINAFASCTKLTTIEGGAAVTKIDDSAFNGCKSLKSFPVMNKLQTIGANAFKGCVKLGKFTLGSMVKSIGKNAFNGCKGLKTITVKTKKLTDNNVGSGAFKGIYKKAKITCPRKILETYKKLFIKRGAPKTCIFVAGKDMDKE